MSGTRRRARGIVSAAVALLVVASVVAGSTAALAADGGATTAPDSLGDGESAASTALAAGGTGDETVENASAGDDPAVAGEDGPGRQRIPDSLRAAFDRGGVASTSAADTVEVVVRFREARAAAPALANSAADLQDHASVTQAPFRAFVRRTPGIEHRQDFWIANAALVEVDPERVSLEQIVDVPHVTRVHRNFEVELADGAATPVSAGERDSTTATASTGGTAATYGLEMVNASSAWDDLGTRGDGVDVAILDTGADPDHPDVDVDGWAEFDSTGAIVESGTNHARDTSYHGTHVAGTVVGGDASGEYIGVAPDVRHHHGLVLPGGSGSYAQVVGGIEWATNEVDADVVSMSLGGSNYAPEFVDPIRNARTAGTLVVASSGNDYEHSSSSPGNVYDAVSVGAVDDQRDVAGFSSGETIDTAAAWGASAPADWPATYAVPQVSAPGVDVFSAWPTHRSGDYAYLDGTSMAAPHVAGAAALLFAGDPDAGVLEVERRLTETAVHPGGEDAHDHRYGHGVIDAYLAARDGTISGVVTGPDGESGIANATVTVTGTETATATTDADGGYTIGGLSPTDNLTVTSDVECYTSANASIDLATGESVTQHFALDSKCGAIEGTVTAADTGDGVANASVRLRGGDGEQAETDETGPNGSYAFETVLHGDDYAVTAGGDRYEPAERSKVSVAPNETATVGVQVTPRPGTVAGTVLDGVTDGPIDNASVSLTNGTGVEIGAVDTGANGEFTIPDVPRADDYELAVAAANYDGWNETFAVGPNETVAPTSSLAPHDGSIRGRVTGNVTGDAIANATVVASGANGTDETNRTSAAGAFELQPVPRAVNYTVSVSHPSYEQARVAVDVGPGVAVERNASVDPSPGTIAGVVTDGDGAPLADATVDLDTADVDPVETAADGSYELSGVPAEREQTLNVSARAHRANATVSATLAANGTATRNVTLHRRDRYLGVDDLQAPDSVEEGENVTVATTATNLGARNWTSNATYLVDGTAVATTALDLNASENATVAFAHVVDEPGLHELTVATANETETVELAVESGGGGGLPAPPSDPAPDVAILSASVGSASGSVDEAIATDVTLRNRGDAAGSIDLTLRADGTTVASRTVDVPAGANRTVTLSTRFDEPGRYRLTVRGETAGTVEISESGGADAATRNDAVDGTTADGAEDAGNGTDVGNGTDAGNGTDSGNGTDDGTGSDDGVDGTPGFGAGAAIVALAVATALAARRRRP